MSILDRIENEKTIWDLIKDTASNKNFWTSGLAASAAACALVITLNNADSLNDNLNIVAGLYSDDFSSQSDSVLD